MTYARIEGKAVVEYPVHEGDLRLRFRNVSFPTPFQPPEGYVKVQDADIPAYDYRVNVAEGPPLLVGSVWTRNWVTTDATAEEIADRVAAQWFFVRKERNEKLSSCDWTQLQDAPVDQAIWAEYRQQLRDITDQKDPFAIIWPAQPK